MILRQLPKDYENYIQVPENSEYNDTLQKNGFIPLYWAGGHFYYKYSKELRKFVEKGGEKNV